MCWKSFALLPLVLGIASALSGKSGLRRVGKTAFIDPEVVQSRDFNQTIWIFWKQGFDHAPYTVQKAVLSWRKHNPSWSIALLSDQNLAQYVHPKLIREWEIYGQTGRAFADVLRLNLLSTYGGVWADATLICMGPLDEWVWNTTGVSDSGIWGYQAIHWNTKGWSNIATYFIIASSKSYSIHAWYQNVLDFMRNPGKEWQYFWLDETFNDLHQDPVFETQWNTIHPKISQRIGPNVAVPSAQLTDRLRTAVHSPDTHVIKLNWWSHAVSGRGNSTDSFGHYAIYTSLGSI
jgi:hypothetical protein